MNAKAPERQLHYPNGLQPPCVVSSHLFLFSGGLPMMPNGRPTPQA